MVIADLADHDMLQKRWSGALPGVVASPAEDVALIFDTYAIDEAIASGPSALGLTEHQYGALRSFRKAVDEFLGSLPQRGLASIPYDEVLADPMWESVVWEADKFVRTFRQEESNRGG